MKDSPYLNLIRWVVGTCSRLELFTNAQHTRRFDFNRIVALPSERRDYPTNLTFDEAFIDVYRKLTVPQGFQCAATGQHYGPLPVPRAVVSPVSITYLRNCRVIPLRLL